MSPLIRYRSSAAPISPSRSARAHRRTIRPAPAVTDRTFLAPSSGMTTHPTSESERDRARPKLSKPQRLHDVLAIDPLLLTPEEAAKVLRVGRTTVFALMKAGELHPVHIGRSCRLSHAELERYVDRLEAPPPPPAPVNRPDDRRQRRRTTATQGGLFDLGIAPAETT
jgi:excisionase family DNA binding protein